MSSTSIDIRELANRLQDLISQAAEGEEVILLDGEIPLARLVPCEPRRRVPGLHPDSMQVGSDFDAPLLEDFWTGQP